MLPILSYSQKLEITINGYDAKLYISQIAGEKTNLIDSVKGINSNFILTLSQNNYGLYRLSFNKNKWIDFINDGKDIELKTVAKDLLDSMKVISSESNKLFYQFIRLNKQYKNKTELLQLILARYPKDDPYYEQTKQRLLELQNGYTKFVNITSQKEPDSFIARYIRSAQLPIIDAAIPQDKQLDYLKAHALDYLNFNDASLINSDVFTNKTIEYLTYYRNPQLPKELLEKEFEKAVDKLLNKAKVNQLVYQHITEYLIDGFKKFGFDQILDYIVENYVIKDDLCLDIKTEGMIQRRIQQAKQFKTGSEVPNIILPDSSGKQIDLNKIDSEKILIIFYVSWCPHCKELMPKLKEMYKVQNKQQFEVLAISLDTDRNEWINFIKNNCANWENVSDLKGWDGTALNNYFIYATPTMFLVDKERKIFGKPMTFDDVRKLLP